MKFILSAALLLASTSGVAYAQELNSTNNAASDAAANSGSVSGAQSSGNQQGQSQNNAGIGSSTSESNSGAVAVTSSESGSVSLSDQGQSQGQSLTNGNTVGQTASNSQGVSVATTFNTTNRKTTEVRTNNAIPLAASSSFSSDYCGGTASGGASAAPLGISIGGSGPTFDKSCQSLRRAEKFGMIAANYHNMKQPEMAMKAMAMMVWSVCTSDTKGPKPDYATAQACMQAGMLGSEGSVTVLEAQKPNVMPETPTTTAPAANPYDHPDKGYRGEATTDATKTPELSYAASLPRMP